MRKSLMLLVTMLLMAMPMRSQVFLTQEDLDSAEPWAPVGSGIVVLAALGGAYLLGKRKKED